MRRPSSLFFAFFLLLAACTGGGSSQGGTNQPDISPSTPVAVMEARIVNVDAENWTFTPNVITAKVGEKVVVHLSGKSGVHSFAIPDLGVNVPVAPGQTVDVALPTDKAGTFSFRCAIPCGSGHKDMKGTIVIEE